MYACTNVQSTSFIRYRKLLLIQSLDGVEQLILDSMRSLLMVFLTLNFQPFTALCERFCRERKHVVA